jgi:hypothetical protein
MDGSKANVQPHVASFCPAQLLHPFLKCCEAACASASFAIPISHRPAKAIWLLSARGKRHGGCRTKPRDELAPSYHDSSPAQLANTQ